MEKNNNHTFSTKPDNKGFSVFVGDDYIGYLVIGEKRRSDEMVTELAKPEVMRTVLTNSALVLQPFSDKVQETSTLDSILSAVAKTEEPADTVEDDLEPEPLLNRA